MTTGTKNKIAGDKDLPNRVVIKFHNHLQFYHLHSDSIIHYLHEKYPSWRHFFTVYHRLQICRLFTAVSPEIITGLLNKARQMDALYHPPDLLSYYVIGFPDTIKPDELLKKLPELEEIEMAYLQSAVINPPAIYSPDPRVISKGYLDPSPEGINATYAWMMNGGKGLRKIKFIDIEQGWITDHEAVEVNTLPLTGINNPLFRDHGVAVLGVIIMKENGMGGSGIAPGVTSYVISQWRPDGMPNDADAVLAAVSYLDFGDILLIETQSFYAVRNNKLWPAEIQEATFQVIRLATALGIIVIEAAGNGDQYNKTGNDLDLLTVLVILITGKGLTVMPGAVK